MLSIIIERPVVQLFQRRIFLVQVSRDKEADLSRRILREVVAVDDGTDRQSILRNVEEDFKVLIDKFGVLVDLDVRVTKLFGELIEDRKLDLVPTLSKNGLVVLDPRRGRQPPVIEDVRREELPLGASLCGVFAVTLLPQIGLDEDFVIEL